MATGREERLEAIRRQLKRQDAAWQRAKADLTQMGDVRLAVPNEAIEVIDDATRLPSPVVLGIRL
jgi:hypothetical protein